MTQIKPFKGYYYNKEKVGDISKVVCPPYDIISKEDQIRLQSLSPLNFVNIILGQEKTRDNRYDNKGQQRNESLIRTESEPDGDRQKEVG